MSDEVSEYTKQKNQDVLSQIPSWDKATLEDDLKDINKGFIASLEAGDTVIKNADGKPAYDIKGHDYIKGEAPDTVNPSLWRQGILTSKAGLFKVTDNIYQVRNFDLAVMTFIKGNTGWIIVDPLTTDATSKRALELVNEKLGKKPVVAVLITHSHADHFGGVNGVINNADVRSGKIPLIVPIGFSKNAIEENILAGNQMARRAGYMFGNLLPMNAEGSVGNGLGAGLSFGSSGFITPSEEISKTGTKKTIDGVPIEFFMANGSEAPSEFTMYFPRQKALLGAEVITHNLHNLYTLRGAKVRDALGWGKYIDQMLSRYGQDVQVELASHHWPMWGNKNIVSFLKNQRDIYLFLHNETLRLAAKGYNGAEIADMIQLPQSLANKWYNRGYYGTVKHNARAIYQYYFGWFDGNPANLDTLNDTDEAIKFVEYMGGSAHILDKAQEDYNKGEYRFVATVLNKLVFAEPDNKEAKNLLAKTYTQLGYQAESGIWRNFYLTGAQELRNGIQNLPYTSVVSPEIITAMPISLLYDYMATLLNSKKVEGKYYSFNINFSDINQKTNIYVENSVLHYKIGSNDPSADATMTLTKSFVSQMSVKKITLLKAIQTNNSAVNVSGNKDKLQEFLQSLDHPKYWFNIVTPIEE